MSMSLALVIATAAPFADLNAIDRQVAQFTGASIGQPGGAATPVDRRLRLRPCGSPLSLAWRGQMKDTVIVQCPDAGAWRLYVPVTAGPQSAPALPLITRGDSVTIEVSGEGFTVSQPGEAMESGAEGAWIKVRTVRNGSRFRSADEMQARVVRPGLVTVPMN